MTNPYDTPPEVDDDDMRPKEPKRKPHPTQLFAIAILLLGIACQLTGNATESACANVMALAVLIYQRFVGDR